MHPCKPREFRPIIPKRLPKRGTVTIAIGFRYDYGALVCSDSLYTDGYLKRMGKKVFRAEIGEDRLVFALAGAVPYAKMTVERAVRAIGNMRAEQRTKAGMRSAVEGVLCDTFETHVFKHPHFGQGVNSPDFQLVVAAWSHLDGLDFYSSFETATTDIEDFEPLGCGQDVASLALKRIFRHRNLSLDDATSVAVYALHEAKEHGSYCGGANQFAFLNESGEMGSKLGLDLSGREELTTAVSQVFRRLCLVAADRRTTDDEIQKELQTIALTIRAARDFATRRHESFSENVRETMKASAPILEPPDFKL